jgi:hypothetical protein
MNVQPKELVRHYAEIRKRLREAPPKPILKLVEPEPTAAPPADEPTTHHCAMCGSEIHSAEPITVTRIIAAVCRHYDVHRMDLIGQRRNLKVARPRQVAMYLARELTALSFGQIGRRMGDRDHSTLCHAVKRIDALILEDHDLSEDIATSRRELLGS